MKYELTIKVGTIEADNMEDAIEQANELLENYAGSNDGSEVMANAKPILKPMVAAVETGKAVNFDN